MRQGPGTIVEISGRRFDVPLDCPCCGAAPDTEIALPLARANRDRAAVSALTVDFPYCRSCAAHVARWDSAGVVRSGLIVIGIVTFVVAAFASELAFGVIALIAATTLALGVASSRRGEARRACSPSCGSVGMSVHYLGWSGTATGFAFESIAYGAKFAEQNASRIVDDPRIRKLLQNYKLARIAVPTPAAAIAVIPPPLGVGEWIARLAATSTRVARRSGAGRRTRDASGGTCARASGAHGLRDRARRVCRAARSALERGRQATSSPRYDRSDPSRQRARTAPAGVARRARAAHDRAVARGSSCSSSATE